MEFGASGSAACADYHTNNNGYIIPLVPFAGNRSTALSLGDMAVSMLLGHCIQLRGSCISQWLSRILCWCWMLQGLLQWHWTCLQTARLWCAILLLLDWILLQFKRVSLQWVLMLFICGVTSAPFSLAALFTPLCYRLVTWWEVLQRLVSYHRYWSLVTDCLNCFFNLHYLFCIISLLESLQSQQHCIRIFIWFLFQICGNKQHFVWNRGVREKWWEVESSHYVSQSARNEGTCFEHVHILS